MSWGSLLRNRMSILNIAGSPTFPGLRDYGVFSQTSRIQSTGRAFPIRPSNANRRYLRNLPLLALGQFLRAEQPARSHLSPHSLMQQPSSCCNSIYHVFANLALSRGRGSQSRAPTPCRGAGGSSSDYPRKSLSPDPKHRSYSTLECL